jgi:hypothetical protein
MGNQGKFLGDSLAVMAGLVPAIHAVMPRNHFPPWESPEATAASVGDKRPAFDPPNRVDGRVEPGHDARPVYLGICPRCRLRNGAATHWHCTKREPKWRPTLRRSGKRAGNDAYPFAPELLIAL